MEKNNKIMEDLLEENEAQNVPKPGDIVKAQIISVGKNEVYVDIPGVTGGLVRGKELINGKEEGRELEIGQEVLATVIDIENEKGLLELSFRSAGQQKAWERLSDASQNEKGVE